MPDPKEEDRVPEGAEEQAKAESETASPVPERNETSGPELARQALAQARAAARERGAQPGEAPRAPRRSRRSGAGGEPKLFGEAVREWLTERGLGEHLAMGGVFGRWSEIVGERLAEHVRPETFQEGRLVLTADSATWASQVRALTPQLLRRLNEELGQGTVQSIQVRGPGKSRSGAGPLRVR